ncbi:DUF3298 and DUF4163 domain-containing protein [Neobacillus sp. CF12]|uniref:DUF3298 and DUF4163 domain-containing protein n=1 Tax=Neobacillus sp. CF12 TaxID=3055864 RepID=UPI0025A2DE67|nr:DUF3298 and DUF4163 domain-containing protein [Neobacillus sp. CF12]MDM5329365.1 DUF3298 and DUF4163 domain-containing protein [Neobacillus sp. CF12]
MNKKILSLFIFLVILFFSLIFYVVTIFFFGSSENNGGGVTTIINETPPTIPDENIVDFPINQSGNNGGCEKQSQSIEIIKAKYQETLDYPKTSNMPLSCKSIEEKINETLEKHIDSSYQHLLLLEEEEKKQRQRYEEQNGHPVPEEMEYIYSYEYLVSYEVKYNENNLLSVLIFDHTYAGGAHGSTNVTSYNFNVSTGDLILLGDVAKNEANLHAIKQYVITELSKREEIFSEDLQNVTIDNNRPFYFTANGISIKFLESEISPYAAGMPEVFIPNEVFP